MRLDINYRKNSVKHTNTWRLNNTLLNNQEITEEIKEKSQEKFHFFNKMKIKIQIFKINRMQQKL